MSNDRRHAFFFALLVLLAAGCGNGDGSVQDTPQPPATGTAVATHTAQPTATDTPTATPSATPTPSPTPTETRPAAVRAVPYDVRDTSQPGQLSVFNAGTGGGSVGMPVRFGDVNGDGDR